MDPAIAFWFMHQDLESAELAAIDLNLRDKQLILCPINDNANGGCADGGGHWTLLVAWRAGKESNNKDKEGLTFKNFRYYDSMSTSQKYNRNRVNAEKLVHLLSGDSKAVLYQASCAQQVNSYDC